MLATIGSSSSRRRAIRRAVQMECTALSAIWDDTAALEATDLSPHGVWLKSELPLEVGAELVLSFRPPRWPEAGAPLTVLARVARVGMPRRRNDAGRSGMGLSFVDLSADACAHMTSLLCGLPPPLPVHNPAVAEPEPEMLSETCLFVDGICIELCAEAPLLTEGRGRPVVPAPTPTRPKAKRRARPKPRSRRSQTRTTRRAQPVVARRPHLRLVG